MSHRGLNEIFLEVGSVLNERGSSLSSVDQSLLAPWSRILVLVILRSGRFLVQ